MTRRVLFIFLDGVGIGPDDPELNPLVGMASRIPTLQGLMGGSIPTLDRPLVEGRDGTAFPLDATLDVEGLPQSGTGQSALLTGESAAEAFGRHFGPWTPVDLRPMVEERNILRVAAERGHSVAFANAYPRGWPGPRGGRRIAAPPLAARAAGVLNRHEEALGRGSAVSSEIVNDAWRTRLGHDWLPEVTPREAGHNLAEISDGIDLTLFAYYATDTVGHRGSAEQIATVLGRLDLFLAGVLERLHDDTLLLVASDHGNLEDVRGGHTRNPALGASSGPGSDRAARLRDLRQVAPFVLEELAGA